MRLTLFIARRFARSLRRDGFARFTSIVSIASVALGCIALVVAMSILTGYEQAIRSAALQFAAPIEVRSLMHPLLGSNAPHVISTITQTPGVAHVEPTLVREALGRTRKGVDGILLMGITPRRARTTLSPILTLGRLPSPDRSGIAGCVVGIDVARRLALQLGDTLVIYTADRGTVLSPILATAHVQGIMRSGMQQYDETAVFIDDAALHTMLRLPAQEASAISVYATDPERLDEVARSLTTALGPRMFVQTYRQRFAAMESWIALQKEPIPIVLGLISLVALFTVVATLLIAVVEKTRQVAVLRTIGMRGRQIAAIFVWQGLRAGITGCLIGCAVAAAFCYAQQTWQWITLDGAIYYVSALPVAFDVMPYLLVAATSVVTSLLASLAPVAIALRIDPARILQFR